MQRRGPHENRNPVKTGSHVSDLEPERKQFRIGHMLRARLDAKQFVGGGGGGCCKESS